MASSFPAVCEALVAAFLPLKLAVEAEWSGSAVPNPKWALAAARDPAAGAGAARRQTGAAGLPLFRGKEGSSRDRCIVHLWRSAGPSLKTDQRSPSQPSCRTD